MIVNPESLAECPQGQVGEIWVSSDSVAQGYWNRPEQTEETFKAYYLEDTQQIGPFLRTGDLGFLLQGQLFITGRLKDLIIIRGRNHQPQDIEFTVQQSNSALRKDCGAAFSIEIAGQERLVVVQEVERSYLRKLNSQEVIQQIIHSVLQEHELDIYVVALLKTASIPKTSSGKIQRMACRAGFLEGNLDVIADWSKTPSQKKGFMDNYLKRCSQLRETLINLGFHLNDVPSYITSIIIGQDEIAEQVRRDLLSMGYCIPVFRYPAVERGKALIRLMINNKHTDEDINLFVEALKQMRSRYKF